MVVSTTSAMPVWKAGIHSGRPSGLTLAPIEVKNSACVLLA